MIQHRSCSRRFSALRTSPPGWPLWRRRSPLGGQVPSGQNNPPGDRSKYCMRPCLSGHHQHGQDSRTRFWLFLEAAQRNQAESSWSRCESSCHEDQGRRHPLSLCHSNANEVEQRVEDLAQYVDSDTLRNNVNGLEVTCTLLAASKAEATKAVPASTA